MIQELNEEQFNTFIRCLMNLKETCNDVDIRNGFIRQRSNDLTSIFEMDLTGVIGQINLPISVLKKKLELFRLMFGRAITIEVVEAQTESESYYNISDGETNIKINFPSLNFMDNKYMTPEELDNIFDLNEEDLILNDDLTSQTTEKIRSITAIFNAPAIQIKFNNDIAAITAITQAKDQFASIKSDIACNINFNGRSNSNLSAIPFSIEHDEVLNFKMYKDPTQDVSLNKFSTKLDEVSINIFSRSAIVDDDENDEDDDI